MIEGSALAAANWRQFGRLAGFTNKKPQYRQPSGRYPFVLLHRGRRGVAPAAAEFLSLARSTYGSLQATVGR